MRNEDPVAVEGYTSLIVAAYRRYRTFWVNLARSTRLSSEDGEDLVHGVIGSLLARREPAFQSMEHVRNYVARSILNRSTQIRQRNQRECEFDEALAFDFLQNSELSGVEEDERRQILREVLESLTRSDFEIVKLRFFAGLTFIEISQMLGSPVSTLKSREDAALRRIRHSMIDRGL